MNLLSVIKFCKYLNCFMWFFLYHLLHLFNLDCFTSLWHTIFFLICEFLKNRRVSWNVNLSNGEKVLHRNLRIDWASECIFTAFEGANFETLSTWHQPWWCLCFFSVLTRLHKKNSGCHDLGEYMVEACYWATNTMKGCKLDNVTHSYERFLITAFFTDIWNTSVDIFHPGSCQIKMLRYWDFLF